MAAQVKYKLGAREDNGLCRVIATVAFSDVSVGDVGGYIESERNLAHLGNAWVAGDAQVYGNARVFRDAQVFGDAQVVGNAWVFGDAQVFGNARVSGNAQVFRDARVSGNAQVFRDAQVFGDARVFGDAVVTTLCSKSPTTISGLRYTITVTDEHLRAGCQVYTFQEWRDKTECAVLAMDGKAALVFYRETLIPLMDVLKLGV